MFISKKLSYGICFSYCYNSHTCTMQNANYHKRVYNVTCHNVIYIIDYLSHLINMVTVTTETQEDCGFCDNQRVKILCQKGITLMLCRYSCLITVELGPCLCMRLTMDLIAQKMIIAIYLHVFVLQSNALKRNIYYTYHVYLYQDSVWLDLVHSSRTEKTFIATM